MALDEPTHPLPPLVNHHSAALLASALSLSEKHGTQIEIMRRRLAATPKPSPATRRVTFLQGIAKATETSVKDSKSETDDRTRRGWDTDAVEDMWLAVLTYIREMGNVFGELSALKDAVDRTIDKANVNPVTRKLTKVNLFNSENPINISRSIANTG